MNKKLFHLLLSALALVFIVSLISVIIQLNSYQKGTESYIDAQKIAGIESLESSGVSVPNLDSKSNTSDQNDSHAHIEEYPIEDSMNDAIREQEDQPIEPNEHEEVLLSLDLSSLQKINSQVKGWIAIPDTNISYPLTQGTDNDYYLKHTWNFEWSSAGAIFLEHLASPDFTDFNTLIYGHRMNNGTMFTGLKHYKSIDFWEEHPEVYIRTNFGVSCYRVYAAYEAKIDAVTYGLELNSEELRTYFIEYGLAKSVIDTGIVPTTDDSVITLVTCTGHGHAARWVVQAVLDHTIPADEAAS